MSHNHFNNLLISQSDMLYKFLPSNINQNIITLETIKIHRENHTDQKENINKNFVALQL